MKNRLTTDYAGIQTAYTMMYAGIGAFISVFLLACGFSNAMIGLTMSAANLLTVFFQPMIADYADRTKRFTLSQLILLIAAAVGAVTAVLFAARSSVTVIFIFYVLAMGIHGFLQPLVNSLNFQIASHGYQLNFGLCRACASLGYSAVTAVLGTLIEKYGINMIPGATEVSLVLLFVFFAMLIRDEKQHDHMASQGIIYDPSGVEKKEEEQQGEITLSAFIRNNIPFLILNIGIVFLFFHSYIIGSFMLQMIEPLGGTSADMGRMFSLAALVEVPVMIASGSLTRRFRIASLLKFSMLGFAVKTLLLYAGVLSGQLWMIYASQLCQFFGYALFYPAMVQFIASVMSEGEAVKGQALFTMMMTVSGVLANITGGVILDFFGVRFLVLMCLITALSGAAVVILMTDRTSKEK